MFARLLLLLLVLAAVLALAAPRSTSGVAAEEPYVVRPGDTLWRLAAQRFRGDPREGVWAIRERNALAGGGLRPGMLLYLPAPAGGA